MKNISLKQLYSCDGKFFKEKINCKNWSIDIDQCKTECSLKKINPSWSDCFNCSDINYILQPQEINEEKSINIEVSKNISPSAFFKAKTYAKAEMSQIIQGKVSEEIYEKRKQICLSCDKKINNDQNESIGWCTACGCGTSARAALSQKLYIPSISCPLKKFGPERGDGFNTKDAINSVKGIINNIKENI